MSTVLLGRNRFVECQSILAYKGRPILSVHFDPLRVALTTPEGVPSVQAARIDQNGWSPEDRLRVIATPSSYAAFWEEHALVLATLLAADTAHLRIDLRPLGIAIYDDLDGLHIGGNVFAENVVSNTAAAINLGD